VSFHGRRRFLRSTIERDPTYAQAWAHKSLVVTSSSSANGDRRQTERDLTIGPARPAQRALQLDSTDAFVLAVTAHGLNHFWAIGQRNATEMFDRSLQLNKNAAFAGHSGAITLLLSRTRGRRRFDRLSAMHAA